jgi:Flp pilus assembly pilin Flp
MSLKHHAAEDREGKRGREHQKPETKHAVVNIKGWSLFFWYCNSDTTGFLSQQVHNACRGRSARTACSPSHHSRRDAGSPMMEPLVMCRPRLCVLRRWEMFLRFCRDRSGSSLIEYALLASVMIALTAVAIRMVGNWASGAFSAFSP